jgi:type IV secretory pathway component VirB8
MEELIRKIDEQQVKIDSIYASVEKLRKYFLWTLIITVATIVLPIIALVVILPTIMSTLGSAYGIGGGLQ